jgi:Mg-chelatase subunit ChlD
VLSILVLVLGAAESRTEESFQLKKVGAIYLDAVVPAPDGEPVTELYLRVETRIGAPVDQLDASSFVIRDNGNIIDSSDVEIEQVSKALRGTSAVLILDTSRSMLGEPFVRAREAALRYLSRMGDFDHVAVITFDDDVTTVADFDTPRTEVRLSLEQLEAQEKTLSKMVWDGASKGLILLRSRSDDLPRRSFMILFSDGRDSNSIHSLDEVIDLANGGANEARIPIFTVGYSGFGGRGLEDLEALSSATGASAFSAASPSQLGRYYDEIWKRMVRSFVIRYPGELDGKRHKVEVTIGSRSDARAADTPDIGSSLWPLIIGIVLLVGAGVAGLRFLPLRTPGRLIFEGGTRSGHSVALRGRKLRIGALEENDLVLNYPTISRYHAQLLIAGSQVEIEDLGSKNGTYVNGTPIRARSQLHLGDRVKFGDVEMVFRR